MQMVVSVRFIRDLETENNNKVNNNQRNTMSERKMIYLCLAHMSDEGYEQKYVKEAFDTNWVVPMGPNVNAFEQELERFVNENDNENEKALDRKVVCLSAGTAAVHLALIACGVGPGAVA